MSNFESTAKTYYPERQSLEQPSPLLVETLQFFADTSTNPMGRLRQVQVAAHGCAAGAIQDAQVELKQHPVETIGKMVASAGTGFILAAMRSRFILGAATLAGAGFMAQSLAQSYDKLSNDKALSRAMVDVWTSDDNLKMAAAKQTAEHSLGKETFNYGLGIACGGAGVWMERRGLSMLFSARGWMDEALGYNSIKWTNMPDGSKVANLSGTRAVRFKDGTRIWEYPNGTRETWHPDGRSVSEHSNGARHVSNADGTQEIYYSNGMKVTLPGLGTRVTELSNGTVVKDFHDGSRCLTKADGTFISTDLNGSKYIRYPNGDTVDEGPHIRPAGARIVYKEAEGTVTTEIPDGKKYSWLGNNNKVYEQNGSKFILKPDGDWYIEPAQKAD